jgi:hypothetical protein
LVRSKILSPKGSKTFGSCNAQHNEQAPSTFAYSKNSTDNRRLQLANIMIFFYIIHYFNPFFSFCRKIF